MSDIRQEAHMTNWAVRSESEARSLEDRAAARLRGLIRDGTFSVGEQLPAEPELAKRLGVSRQTLRAALAELVTDNILTRRRGVGTFVAESAPLMSHGLERLLGTGESIEMRGSVPGTSGLTIDHVSASEEVAARLQLDLGAAVVHISRTRTANGVAVLHCEEWVPEDLLPEKSTLDGFSSRDSLYSCLEAIGLPIKQAVARFVPLIPDELITRRLNMPPGVPVLLLEQEHFLATDIDRIVLYSKNYYNTQLIELHTLRK